MAGAMIGNHWSNKEEKARNLASEKSLSQVINILPSSEQPLIKVRNPRPGACSLYLLFLSLSPYLSLSTCTTQTLCQSVLEFFLERRLRPSGNILGTGSETASEPRGLPSSPSNISTSWLSSWSPNFTKIDLWTQETNEFPWLSLKLSS